MKLELKVTYNNADSGEIDEQIIEINTENEKIFFLATTSESRPTDEVFDKLFKKMYDNPTMDGLNTGSHYEEIWQIMSRRAFEKLGWYDVTVDVIGLVVDGEKTKLEKLVETGMIDNKAWSLQLSRDGFMYCYA
ncbi:hypothetical protein N9E84_03645 [Planktomarina temperata]|nr:hypothetical protein [Planktomarina temperata]MDB0071638.1 hypothetical protein [Planktomarina temperata]